MQGLYLTIGSETRGLYKEKGSKFLSFAFPVNSEDEAFKHIERIKKEYHDARHHCYAYLLGRGGKTAGKNDAGEPRHTAGNPILNQIRSCNLTDVLVVVVRYFGGTKLGKSGLINAYKKAAEDALNKVQTIEKHIYKRMSIHFDYDGINDVMRLIDMNHLQIVGQSYQQEATITIRLKETETDRIMELLSVLPHINDIIMLSG
jgi:uncharacterized YigZ family protein